MFVDIIHTLREDCCNDDNENFYTICIQNFLGDRISKIIVLYDQKSSVLFFDTPCTLHMIDLQSTRQKPVNAAALINGAC